jgi:hypothetical protein
MTIISPSSTGTYLLNRIPSGVNPKSFFDAYALTSADESALLGAAREDTRKLVYNAVATFLGGMSGLHTQQVVWAVTKMYYSAFYVGRAALCRIGHLIFHVPKESGRGNTQYEIKIVAGQRANVVDKYPSTHKLVAHRFQEMGYPPFMRSLTIDGADPLLWLMEQREYWQYRAGRFCDPDLPRILDQIKVDKAQRFLAEYAADRSGLYLSDPAHAIVAVPFRLITWALAIEPIRSPGVVDQNDIAYLRKRCTVGKQTLSVIGQYLQ